MNYRVVETLKGDTASAPRLRYSERENGARRPAPGEKVIAFWDDHFRPIIAPFTEQGVQATRAGIAEAAATPL
jgi:hypothetical protein